MPFKASFLEAKERNSIQPFESAGITENSPLPFVAVDWKLAFRVEKQERPCVGQATKWREKDKAPLYRAI